MVFDRGVFIVINWIKGLIKKKKPQKIRITIKDDKFVSEYHPAVIRKTISCYDINGSPYLQGLERW